MSEAAESAAPTAVPQECSAHRRQDFWHQQFQCLLHYHNVILFLLTERNVSCNIRGYTSDTLSHNISHEWPFFKHPLLNTCVPGINNTNVWSPNSAMLELTTAEILRYLNGVAYSVIVYESILLPNKENRLITSEEYSPPVLVSDPATQKTVKSGWFYKSTRNRSST